MISSKETIELQKYAMLQNDEYGEFCLSLLELYTYTEFMNDKLKDILEKEIWNRLQNFKQNTKIIEDTTSIKKNKVALIWL